MQPTTPGGAGGTPHKSSSPSWFQAKRGALRRMYAVGQYDSADGAMAICYCRDHEAEAMDDYGCCFATRLCHLDSTSMSVKASR
jgi:hypothetical protein